MVEVLMRARPDTEPGYEEDGRGNWRIVYPDGSATYGGGGRELWRGKNG